MKQAANALNWCVAEMERRYKLMSWLGVRNLSGYNHKVAEAEKPASRSRTRPRSRRASRSPSQPLPLHRGGDRRARRPDDGGRQEGRGADRAPGAEGARLGHPPDPRDAAPVGGRDHRPDQGQHPDAHRVPGVEQGRLAHHPRPDGRRGAARRRATCSTCRRAPACRSACTAPSSPTTRCTRWSSYLKNAGQARVHRGRARAGRGRGRRARGAGESRRREADPLYDQAVEIVLRTRRPSISLVQRHLRIGYNRAARLIEQMERAGMVSAMQSNGNREVLVPDRRRSRLTMRADFACSLSLLLLAEAQPPRAWSASRASSAHHAVGAAATSSRRSTTARRQADAGVAAARFAFLRPGPVPLDLRQAATPS